MKFPRSSYLSLLATTVAALLAGSTGSARAEAPAETAVRRPNIIFILADDLGQRDLGVYGSTFYETPHLDRLAARGARFTQAYAASGVCSPTRASLLTGRYPARSGITDWLPGRPDRPDQLLARPPLPTHLPLAEVTFAEAFREAGYRTAFVGKWHLGDQPEHFPEHQGFDVNIGGSGRGAPPSFFSPHRLPYFTDGPPGEHLDDRLTREAIAFIAAAAAKSEPFLVYLSHYAVHTPLQGKPALVSKYEAKLAAAPPAEPDFATDGPDGRRRVVQNLPIYAAMVENLDTNIGRLLLALEALDLTDDTIVIFTSDNGGLATAEGWPTTNLPLRTGKGWAYEGGVREPLLVAWPGTIPAGSVLDTVVTSPDLFPTLLDLAGLPPRPQDHLDGRSFASVLRSPTVTLPERPIFWHYPHYSNQRGRPHGAIRSGRWKLIEWFEDGRLELYDLAADLGETNDLAPAEPALARRLLGELQAWRQSVGARLPTSNPNYQGGGTAVPR